MADGAWPQNLGARLWRLPPGSANTLHQHLRAEEFYFVLEGGSPVHRPPLVPSASSVGRMRISPVHQPPLVPSASSVGWETLTVPKHGGVLVGPEQLRQVFNDTDTETLWLIAGTPEELEFLQGSKSQMDISPIYPQDPTQLPPELAGQQWPPPPNDA